ncbi:MAG: PilZ domain-containing protein [Polyangiaceae bacterium]|nr:PilZ domain-containing protein [Polyangiaceae bacterium]
MANDRRSAPRASLPGIRADYEGASGDPQRAEVLNLSGGGLFLLTDTPLAVGKRVALDVYVTGEPAPWSALGRVVWTRTASEGPERPAGMGVKLIDVEDAVVVTIARLIMTREPTEPGMGDPTRASPPPASPASPGATPEPPTDTTLAIELVAKKGEGDDTRSSPVPASRGAGDDEKAEAPLPVPTKNRSRGSSFLAFLVVLLVAGGSAAYAFRDELPSLWARARAALNQGIERLR